MDILTINEKQGEYPKSYYAATAHDFAEQPKPEGDIRCDVCVVGGGLMGVSSALHLAKAGYKVVLLEANRIGWGASGRNGGQINTGQRLEQEDLEKAYGEETAHKLWDIADQAVGYVKTLIAEHNIDCGFKPGVIISSHKASHAEDFKKSVELMTEKYGVTTQSFLDRDALYEVLPTEAYKCGMLDTNAGHLHPLNFIRGLARAAQEYGAVLYEKARVVEVKEGQPATVKTDSATVTADYVIVGTNGYGGDLVRESASYIMPINGFIGATRPLSEEEWKQVSPKDYAVADSKFVINYFRLSQDKRLLFGGGESYGYRFPEDLDAHVRKPMSEIFPQLADVPFDYCWGGTLGITMTRMPYFRRRSGNVLNIGGFSGHGVALSTFSGKIAAETIAGQAETFDIMASLPPTRFPGGPRMRTPLLILAMTWYGLRDRLGL